MIHWVGKAEDLPAKFKNAVQTDLKGKILTPGLIDCHTHIVFGGERSAEYAMRAAGKTYQEIARAGGGILSTVRATRETPFDELFSQAKERVEESMNRGITTIEIKSGYGLTLEDELKILQVIKKLRDTLPLTIVPTLMGAHAIPPEFTTNRQGYLALLCENLIPQVAKMGLATFCDVFVEKNHFTPDEGRQILECALRHGLKPKIHAEQLSDFGGSKVAADLHAVSADHLEYLSEKDLKALIEAGVTGVLLPGASFFLGTPYPPARKFIDAGLPVAISTDWNPGTSMSGDLLLMMTIAMSQMKMTIAETFAAVTYNGARALGFSDRGSIEIGKRADLAIFDAPSFIHLPYHFGTNHLSGLVIKGKSIK